MAEATAKGFWESRALFSRRTVSIPEDTGGRSLMRVHKTGWNTARLKAFAAPAGIFASFEERKPHLVEFLNPDLFKVESDFSIPTLHLFG